MREARPRPRVAPYLARLPLECATALRPAPPPPPPPPPPPHRPPPHPRRPSAPPSPPSPSASRPRRPAAVPQENTTTKRLAIGSIALYAACSHYFLACAPEALHQDSRPPCKVDADTYLQRGWCRLEQWAFMAINGSAQMYVFDSSLSQLSSRRRWIEESVNVFNGHFTHEADKALLVDVVLGLYGLAVIAALDPSVAAGRHLSCGKGPQHVPQQASPPLAGPQLIELIAERRGLIFPRQHFGDLVDRLEAELEWGARESECLARESTSTSTTYRAARTARRTLDHTGSPSHRTCSV